MMIIPLAPPSLAESSDLPGDCGRAVRMTSPYLVLLRAGFCLPPMLPRARCALTAPFHHCLPAGPKGPALHVVGRVFSDPATSAVCFLCHCPSGCPDRALPGALPCGVRTFLSPFGERSSGLLRTFHFNRAKAGKPYPPTCRATIHRSPAKSDTARASCT